MEPGKIPHEIRHGELAQLGILPYQPYYGTHDATSLFVIVLSYLYHWIARPGAAAPLPARTPRRRCAWIDRYGDRDSDGFQEYPTRSSHGHYNQGWKDAGDAIVEADGTLSPLPIATCELQGYVYDAKIRMADVYDVLERPRGRPAAAARGETPVRPLQRDVLVGGGGHLLPGPQRAQGAHPERRVERRATCSSRGSSRRSAPGGSSAG